jgi:hypothetical protein
MSIWWNWSGGGRRGAQAMLNRGSAISAELVAAADAGENGTSAVWASPKEP